MLVGFVLLGVLPLAAMVFNRSVLRHDPVRVLELCILLGALAFYTAMYLTEDDADTRRTVIFQAMSVLTRNIDECGLKGVLRV